MEKITMAAIHFEGETWSRPRPARHHDVIAFIIKSKPGLETVGGTQGFLTSEHRFVDREEARKIAEAAGQLIAGRRDNDGVPYVAQDDRLFSEDVW